MRDLFQKTAILISLVSAQSVLSLYLLDTASMIQQDTSITFQLGIIKHSKPRVKSTYTEFQAYPQDNKLCVVKKLKCFLERTHCLRGEETRLFIP